MKVPAFCFALACLTLRFELVISDISGQYLSPPGCTSNCVYNLTWYFDMSTDKIYVTIIGTQPVGSWIGMAIGNTTLMETQRVYYGYMDASNVGHVVEAWVGSHYSAPVTATISNIGDTQIVYSGGIFTLTFSRPRVSADKSQDFSFTDTTGFYFKYVVGGGSMSGSTIKKHFQTPDVSSSTICVCSVAASTLAGGSSGGSSMASGASSMVSAASSMGPSMPPSPPPSGQSPPPSGASPPPSGPSMPPSPPPSGGSMGPSGASMPPSPPPSGASPPPSGPSMPPSPPPSGGSMGPSGTSMPPSPPPSGPSMPPSPPPTGGSMGPSEQPSGGSTSNPSTGGSGSSSNATKKTLIASLVVFGALAALVMLVCVCYTISSTTTTTAAYSGF